MPNHRAPSPVGPAPDPPRRLESSQVHHHRLRHRKRPNSSPDAILGKTAAVAISRRWRGSDHHDTLVCSADSPRVNPCRSEARRRPPPTPSSSTARAPPPDPIAVLPAPRFRRSESLVSLPVPRSRSCRSPRLKSGRSGCCRFYTPRRAAAELASRGAPPLFPLRRSPV